MTSSLSTPAPGGVVSLELLRAKWGWIVALGVVYLIAGIDALASVVAATVASVFVVGIMMLFTGVVAFERNQNRGIGKISADTGRSTVPSTTFCIDLGRRVSVGYGG